jgi:hypothetical protein
MIEPMQVVRLASVGILAMEDMPDVWKLLFLYFIDSLDCIPGPCPEYSYQSVDKLIDLFTYVCILVYFWPKFRLKWLLIAAFVFRLIGLRKFFKTQDHNILVQFPDYFRELTLVDLMVQGDPTWWIIGVLVIKPFIEIRLHGKPK